MSIEHDPARYNLTYKHGKVKTIIILFIAQLHNIIAHKPRRYNILELFIALIATWPFRA